MPKGLETTHRLRSDEIACLMTILSSGLRERKSVSGPPLPAAKQPAVHNRGGRAAYLRTTIQLERGLAEGDEVAVDQNETTLPFQPPPRRVAAVDLELQYSVALEGIEAMRVAEQRRTSILHLPTEVKKQRRPQTAVSSLQHPRGGSAHRPATATQRPHERHDEGGAQAAAATPPMVVGQSIQIVPDPTAAATPREPLIPLSSRPQRPLTAPSMSGRPTSAGPRPLSSKKPREPMQSASSKRHSSIVAAVCHQQEALRERAEEDEDIGIIDDDGDDGEEDAPLETLMPTNAKRSAAAQHRPPLSAKARAHDHRADNAPSGGASRVDSAHLVRPVEVAKHDAADHEQQYHALGTADVAHIRGDAPSPLYFSTFRFTNIGDFLHHQKSACFGQYRERVDEFQKAARHKLGADPPMGTSGGGPSGSSGAHGHGWMPPGASALPSPMAFRSAVEAEAHRRSTTHRSAGPLTGERATRSGSASRRSPVHRNNKQLAATAVDRVFSRRPMMKASVQRW